MLQLRNLVTIKNLNVDPLTCMFHVPTVIYFPHFTSSDAKRRADVMLLPVSHKGPTVDLASNEVLYNLPPVAFQTRIRGVFTSRYQVS